MEITDASAQDLPLIRQLAELTFHATYLPLQPKEKVDYLFAMMYSTSSLEQQMQNGQRFILAKDAADYLGFASYEINCKKNGLTKIHKLYVLPTAQGRGVGKKLVDAIAVAALKNNNQTLSLNVYRQNPAIDFYVRIGFKIAEEVNIDVGNGFMMNDFVMERDVV